MPTKIQINSLEALERLIGGDSETEIEIRKSVVAEFCKRHLKQIADGPIVMSAIREVINEAKSIAESKVRNELQDRSKFTIELSVSWKNAIERCAERSVRDFVDREISNQVRQKVDEMVAGVSDRITASVKHYTEYAINEKVREKLQKTIAGIK